MSGISTKWDVSPHRPDAEGSDHDVINSKIVHMMEGGRNIADFQDVSKTVSRKLLTAGVAGSGLGGSEACHMTRYRE